MVVIIGSGELLLWLYIICKRLVCLVLVGRLVEGLLCCILMMISGSLIIRVKFMVFDLSVILGLFEYVILSFFLKEVLIVV